MNKSQRILRDLISSPTFGQDHICLSFPSQGTFFHCTQNAKTSIPSEIAKLEGKFDNKN